MQCLMWVNIPTAWYRCIRAYLPYSDAACCQILLDTRKVQMMHPLTMIQYYVMVHHILVTLMSPPPPPPWYIHTQHVRIYIHGVARICCEGAKKFVVIISHAKK